MVKVQGTPDHEGMVIDFIRLKNIVKENVLVHLDHACINDILPQPSAENISVWVWNKLKDLLHGDNYDLYEVEVWETKTSGCIYSMIYMKLKFGKPKQAAAFIGVIYNERCTVSN